MRPKTLGFIGYVLIVVSASFLPVAFGQENNSNNSSLADLARQLRQQRAGSGLAPVRIFTNDNLPVISEDSPGKSKLTGSLVKDAGYAAPSEGGDVHFRPAEVERVADIVKPVAILAYGNVVLDVLISETGEVENVEVRRDVPSLTDVAIRSVRTWTFQPAQANGQSVASRMTVAVSFNAERNRSGGVDLPLPPLIHQTDEERIQSSLQPPEVTGATLPPFPYGALENGTVILRAIVNEEGKAGQTTVLRHSAPFEPTALDAVTGWRFIPATLNGAPIDAPVVMAFVFTQPNTGP
jgi:TonB family protein